MKVESYEVEEINSSEAATMAADSEAIEMIQRLGLCGQQSLANKDTDTRNHYRRMTKEEMAVFDALFPNKTAVQNYSDGILPLRVLQILSHAKETGFFKHFNVWHPPAGQRDPILVGYHEEPYPGQTWTVTQEFLLARWGETLASFDELRNKAKTILLARWSAKIKTAKSQLINSESALSEIIDSHLLGQDQKQEPQFIF